MKNKKDFVNVINPLLFQRQRMSIPVVNNSIYRICVYDFSFIFSPITINVFVSESEFVKVN